MHLGVQGALVGAGHRVALVRQPRLAGSEQQLSTRLEGACRVRVRVRVRVRASRACARAARAASACVWLGSGLGLGLGLG